MSEKKDLVVKMTINSTDFDNGLKNAKSQMKQTEGIAGSAGASMKKAFGAVAVAVGAAATAMKGIEKVMRGTEQGADAMDRSLRVAKDTTNKFFQSINNGSFDQFLKGLSDIASNAKEAYDALDKLGTMKMWSGARISQLQAQIAEDRVIVNSSGSNAAKQAAQERISLNMSKIKALSGDLADATLNAMSAKLREMSGVGKDVSDEMLRSYVSMFEKGTLMGEAEKFLKEHSYQQLHSYTVGNAEGMPAYNQQYYTTEFDTAQNRSIYNAMKSLATITEGEGGWADYYKLMEEEATQRIQLANQENKANKLINSGGSGSGSSSSKSTGLSVEQMTEMLRRQLESGVFSPQDNIIPLEDLIQNEEIIEEDTDALVESFNERRKAMADLAVETAQAITMFNALGSVFTQLGNLSGDNMFGNIASGLGSIVSQASSTVSAMMALAGAETIEGLAETFANAPMFTKVALTATALAGVLSVISTAKNAFAGSFADGGIVGGNSYSGDRLWARVNSGEMILNRSQQAALMNGGNVKFVIEGSQLKGVLDNYESIQNM